MTIETALMAALRKRADDCTPSSFNGMPADASQTIYMQAHAEIARLQAQVADAWSVHARAVESSGSALAGHLSTIQELRAQVDVLSMALRNIGMYTGEGPSTTPWQEIVRDVAQKARDAVAATGL